MEITLGIIAILLWRMHRLGIHTCLACAYSIVILRLYVPFQLKVAFIIQSFSG